MNLRGMDEWSEKTSLVSWQLGRDQGAVQEGDLDRQGREFQALGTPNAKALREDNPWPESSI